MNMLDIDWAHMRAAFLVVCAILSVPLLTMAGGKLDELFGEKSDAYILKLWRKYDERKARKTR